jgi:hypothetical protein
VRAFVANRHDGSRTLNRASARARPIKLTTMTVVYDTSYPVRRAKVLAPAGRTKPRYLQLNGERRSLV